MSDFVANLNTTFGDVEEGELSNDGLQQPTPARNEQPFISPLLQSNNPSSNNPSSSSIVYETVAHRLNPEYSDQKKKKKIHKNQHKSKPMTTDRHKDRENIDRYEKQKKNQKNQKRNNPHHQQKEEQHKPNPQNNMPPHPMYHPPPYYPPYFYPPMHMPPMNHMPSHPMYPYHLPPPYMHPGQPYPYPNSHMMQHMPPPNFSMPPPGNMPPPTMMHPHHQMQNSYMHYKGPMSQMPPMYPPPPDQMMSYRPIQNGYKPQMPMYPPMPMPHYQLCPPPYHGEYPRQMLMVPPYHIQDRDFRRKDLINIVKQQLKTAMQQLPKNQGLQILQVFRCVIQYNTRKEIEDNPIQNIKQQIALTCYYRSLDKLQEWIYGNDQSHRQSIMKMLYKLQIQEDVIEKIEERKNARKMAEESKVSDMKRMLNILVGDPRKLII